MPRMFGGDGMIHTARGFDESIDQGVENLCAAVVHQAVLDYRNQYAALLRNSSNVSVQTEVRELEKFFRSERFRFFSDLDAETIINKVRRIAQKQVAERKQEEVLASV